jgi:uncharacterized Zn finger protein
VEESAYSDTELRAARTLARSGRIGSVTIRSGGFLAAVEDADRDHDTVAVSVPRWDDAEVATFVELVAAESGRIAGLLAGDLPHRLVEEAEEAGLELLPYGGELGASCTCPSWVDPCEHALAVGYQVAWLLDADPLVLLALRGLPREELLARLHARADDEPAPEAEMSPDEETGLEAALRAARILDLLDELDGSTRPGEPEGLVGLAGHQGLAGLVDDAAGPDALDRLF